jgi:hypothetical protein
VAMAADGETAARTTLGWRTLAGRLGSGTCGSMTLRLRR